MKYTAKIGGRPVVVELPDGAIDAPMTPSP